MHGNTTAPAADAVWLSVAAVRGPLEVLGYQSLAFSPGVSLLGLVKQVCAWISLQLQHSYSAAEVVPPQMLPEDYRSIVSANGYYCWLRYERNNDMGIVLTVGIGFDYI